MRLEFLTQENDASPLGRAFFQIRGVFAELERNTIRDRTMRGKLEKARQGRVVNPRLLPRWLRIAADGTTVVLDPAWAPIVEQVFAWFVGEPLTVRQIATRLTEMAQPTPSGGRVWQHATIDGWLRNPAAKGQLLQFTHRAVEPRHRRKPIAATASHRPKSSVTARPPDEAIAMAVPAIVDEARWAAVQRRLGENRATARRNAHHRYLLRGLLVHADCGRRMTGACRRPDQETYRCLHATPRADGTGRCVSRGTPARVLERAV